MVGDIAMGQLAAYDVWVFGEGDEGRGRYFDVVGYARVVVSRSTSAHMQSQKTEVMRTS